MKTITGRVWVFGDNVDTDGILPGPYLVLANPEDLGKHAMEGVNGEFPKIVRPGDIIVAGRNFGCGSSREQAPVALKAAGVAAVIADSFARIFFRNAINIGLPVLASEGIRRTVEDGDMLTIEVREGQIANIRTGSKYQAEALPDFILEIIEEGGILPHLKSSINR